MGNFVVYFFRVALDFSTRLFKVLPIFVFFVYDNECNYIIIHYMIVCTVDVIVRISG